MQSAILGACGGLAGRPVPAVAACASGYPAEHGTRTFHRTAPVGGAAEPIPCGGVVRGLTIREAVWSDRDAMVDGDRIAWGASARADLVRKSPRRASPCPSSPRPTLCLVAEQDGRVVGYGVLEYTFFGNGFVSMLYVAAPQRRQGVGGALLQALAERCATTKLFTSTNESNEPMQRLLGRLGYVPSGVVENLDPGDPELFYFLDLSEQAT